MDTPSQQKRPDLTAIGTEHTKSVYDPHHEPVATVQQGEKFTVDTLDCFGGRFQGPEDYTTENVEWVEANLNPLTGPIEVLGAKAGDIIAVTIESVKPTTPGRFVRSRYEAASPQDWWLEEFGFVNYDVRDGAVWVAGVYPVPMSPVIGCIGTAPKVEVVASPKQGTFGGNLDCNLIRPGATVELPVNVDGAKLYFGDVKATMGDGEIVNAAEVGSRITASVDVRPRPPAMKWPRVLTSESRAVVVSGRSVSQAGRDAFSQLALWLQEESDAPREHVIQVLGMAAHVRICQVSNPLHTAHCEVPEQEVYHLTTRDPPALEP